MALIATRQLTGLCRRVGISLEAGIDARSAWQRESQRGTAGHRRHLERISERVAEGDSVADALRDSGGYFPPLVCEMVTVGEQTGKLDAVLLKLADHYDHLLKLRRIFLMAIAWPVIQLVAAVLIIGALIGVMGMIAGDTIDVLGVGVTGMPAVGLFFASVALTAVAIAIPIVAVTRGWLGSAPARLALCIPVVGRTLQTMALARMAWSMSVASEAGMDVRLAMKLSLRATQSPFYVDQVDKIDAILLGRGQIHEALRQVGGYPDEFLDSVETGELTGMLAESMGRLAADYSSRAQASTGVLATLAGFAAWGLMAAMMIFLIVRLFWVLYISHIYEALEAL